MAFFKRRSEKPTTESAPGETREAPEAEGSSPQPVGLVSGVLTGDRQGDGESPHGDIVERRFGPGSDRSDPEPDDSPLPGTAEAPGLDEGDPDDIDDADLEVDPMAHIGRSTTITGDIDSDEDLEVQGTVEGAVRLASHLVTVGDEGLVKGRVAARAVVVAGRIEGDVAASERVEVRSGGFIGGNVEAPRVILQDGAIVIGGLDMSAALPKEARAERDRLPPARAAAEEPERDKPSLQWVEGPAPPATLPGGGG